MNTKVSIVIITKDTKELLRGLLNSIKNDLSFQPYIGKIIIVDNASADGTEKMIREEFPAVIYVRNERNMGFAFSANRGSALAEDEYVLFLNSDTVLIQGELEKMVRYMDSNENVGICGPQLVYPDMKPQRSSAAVPSLSAEFFLRGRSRVQGPGFRVQGTGSKAQDLEADSRFTIHDSQHLDASRFPLPAQDSSLYSPTPDPPATAPEGRPRPPTPAFKDVASLIGAAILVRREILKAIGGFDERFFFFLEETDLCVRMWQAGHRVVFFPEARIIHLQGKTVRKSWINGRMEYNISLHKFMKKHHSLTYYSTFGVVRFVKVLPLCLLFPFLFFGRRLRLKYIYYLKLMSWYFRGCPENAGLRPGKR